MTAAFLLAFGLLATVAQAQNADPYATTEQQAKQNDLDTDVTPVAKPTEFWNLVHGAKFPDTDVIPGSVTTFDTDLFAVKFSHAQLGLAGGSACAITPNREPGETDEAYGERVGDCIGTDGSQIARVPVLYRFTASADSDASWERLELPGDQHPGYVGAIAWIDAERALIVGGTGTYPRREPPADGKPPTDPEKADPAGKARAWLYEEGSLSELDLSGLTADERQRAGMRGLSAVDCFEDPKPEFNEKKIELCFAGGLGQIWEWRDGEFNGKRIDAMSPREELADPSLFRYRVRDLVFRPVEPPEALAATAGCCSSDPAKNEPGVVEYESRSEVCYVQSGCDRTGPPRWFAQGYVEHAPPLRDKVCASSPLFPQMVPFDRCERLDDLNDLDTARREVSESPHLPDSVYDLSPSGSAILTPGGPESPGERPSVLLLPANRSNAFGSLTRPGRTYGEEGVRVASLGTGRLVDGSGDVASEDARRPSGTGGRQNHGSLLRHESLHPPEGGDGIPDWAVGELRSTRGEGVGARGLVVATALPPSATESANVGWNVNLSTSAPGLGLRPTPEEAVGGWQPVDEAKLDSHVRSRHFLLPSYASNAVDIVGEQEDGWAVGDHGAILRLAVDELQDSIATAEPSPPRLGAGRQASLSEREAYPAAEIPETAGAVPALGGARQELSEPRVIAAGPLGGSIAEIVMSRDGSEGWAIGADAQGSAALARYDGMSWVRCNPIGIEGRISPDRSCAAIAPLVRHRDKGGALKRVRLLTATRVPLENDADPTNDDELEVFAVGQEYEGPETGGERMAAAVRYRDGRWQFEDHNLLNGFPASSQVFDVAFTSPTDGWLLVDQNRSRGLFHFDGNRWAECRAEPDFCHDSGRLPPTAEMMGPRPGLAVAGSRVYLYGSRAIEGEALTSPVQKLVPLILYLDPGGKWTDGSASGEDGGGFDPGFANPGAADSGRVDALTVTQRSDGAVEGWAFGHFSRGAVSSQPLRALRFEPQAALMRLDPQERDGWRRVSSPGAYEDYASFGTQVNLGGVGPKTHGALVVSYPSEARPDGVFVGHGPSGNRIFGLDSARDEFVQLRSPRPQRGSNLHLFAAEPAGPVEAMAPDGHGGFWASIDGYAFHYTDRPLEPVFDEVANPLGRRGSKLLALGAGEDGSVWAASDSARLYRYERGLGWEQRRVPGWDPGRVVTRTSRAEAIAVGPGGEGLVVGEGGRIAEIAGDAVRLDAAAGRSCALGDGPPCGTSRDLTAVDIAPDGSAMAAGEALVLLWRPAGGEFRSIGRPRAASSTRIEAVSLPTAKRAYLATATGRIFRGDLSGDGSWSWKLENGVPGGGFVSADPEGDPIPIRDIAIDDAGHGYAVGDDGLILERSEAGGWRRLPTPYLSDLTEVSLPTANGEGVLIGGRDGLILTGAGAKFDVARPADFHGTGHVVGFAFLPGSTEGSVDAWVGIAPHGDGDSRLLRHLSDPGDPLLDPAAGRSALDDTPGATPSELSVAAFGKVDCDRRESELCPEMTATTTTNEVIVDRIVDEIAAKRQAGGLDLAVLTGDATDAAGRAGSALVGAASGGSKGGGNSQMVGQIKHRRFTEAAGDPLMDAGVTLFGAVGGQDLSENFVCEGEGHCESTKALANVGENYAWREAFAGQAEPWGDGDDLVEIQENKLEFVAVPGAEDGSVRTEDQAIDVDGEGEIFESKAAIGGANTHYAVEAVRDGERVARIVFVDTSMRSLQASDPLQQPQEPLGGQARFLERMICTQGGTTSTGDECTRGKDQAAIVVSNTPTYSYGPGALTHTATDANVFEALVLKHDVDLVISGALGYNGLYYTLAPGIHEPCPGGEHPEGPPNGGLPSCAGGTDSATAPLEEQGVPNPQKLLEEQGLSGAVPTLIAAGAGGKFGPDGQQQADGPAGQWHGYSIAHLQANGEVAVEQRPILDWIGMDADDHTLHARSRLGLQGYGRSPVSTTTAEAKTVGFHYDMANAAITHRYDLVLADPDQPWLPCEAGDPDCEALHAKLSVAPGEPMLTSQLASAEEPANASAAGADSSSPSDSASQPQNPCAPYLCLPKRIGTVDRLSGEVKAKDGKYPETFAIAMLSVDDKVATYPLVFKPSPSFVVTPFEGPPSIPANASPAAQSPPTLPKPQIPSLTLPTPPSLPAIPPLVAATPPEPAPPAPPAPPPPTEQPSPLNLSVAPTGLTVATPTAVIQPPTPPVNPAPPGGARREARQRQAAAQKSGADADESAKDAAGDLAEGPVSGTGSNDMVRHESPATRLERARSEGSFTPLRRSQQPSAWATGALYGGGITLMAFALAAGWSRGRPTPRRREPRLPAPAFGEVRRRRRP